ncbi:MAG: 5-amino-6-(D-ribitylamino)uracil--L-tyrosine 4-hydroxyphenyl transferase CofH [Acidimicrobiia bacterium]|nr:5-amino-6-(D-ribitylamino)uracil--L-tyrosine 4-hydroxyphenyl transferase CofH [Acidimicrobiia bacterium]
MTNITYLRLRPAEDVNELWAATRRKAGTTVAELEAPGAEDVAGALAGGLLPVSRSADHDGAEPIAWVVAPSQAIELAEAGVSGWRITVCAGDNGMQTLDAVARSEAAYLRVGRSHVSDGVELASLPGISTVVSVFVDTVADAVAAVELGAGDLLLRDWDTESILELRDALAERVIVERTAVPPGLSIDDARKQLPEPIFTTYLNQIDSTGTVRPSYEWAPGKDMDAPVPSQRFSAQWQDDAWRDLEYELDLRDLPGDIAGILERSLDGTPPTRDEIEILLSSRGVEVDAIAAVADQLRRDANGDTVTYVVNRNINYTNQCYFRCGFCAFSKGPRSLNLRGEPYLMSIPQVVEKSVEAWNRGATEVCLQGGIHPQFTGDFYVTVVESIKEHLPEMHIHGFTPLEVWQGAETLGTDLRSYLTRLRDAGLGTLPGTAAEILDDRVRQHLCPDKIRTAQWSKVMVNAHELGLRSTATIMFGHIDDPAAWANHFEVLRQIQRRTGGFTEVVPLPFVHMGAPIYLRRRSRPGPTWDEVVLIHAVARIAFAGLIDNIQSSWVKLGLEAGRRLLDAGCNDMGGTLMDEIISRSAGAAHGRFVEAGDFIELIESHGRVPQRRDTLYRPLPAPAPRVESEIEVPLGLEAT